MRKSFRHTNYPRFKVIKKIHANKIIELISLQALYSELFLPEKQINEYISNVKYKPNNQQYRFFIHFKFSNSFSSLSKFTFKTNLLFICAQIGRQLRFSM